MSIIGKIRENSLLIFITVGVAMLLFIIDPTQVMNWLGGNQRPDVIGKFRGEDISASEWKYDQYTQGATDDQQKNQIWQEMIKDTLFKMELSKLDLDGLSKEELNALIWGEPGIMRHPNIQSVPDFQDANGQFSEDSLRKKLPQILSNPAMKPRWKQFFEEPLKKQRNREKYLAMIKHGLYVTSFEVKETIKDEETKTDISFVYKNYAAIADSLVSYTDEDLKKYYEEHKNEEEYEQKIENRAFDYIDMEIAPSEEDKAKALDKLSSVKDDLAVTKEDSLFVLRFAETATYDGIFKKADFFPAQLDSVLQKADSGTIIGPYIEENFYKISKVVATKPQKEATVRHILLAFNNDTSDENDKRLKKKADSIVSVLRSKKNFDELVEKFSDDPGSKNNGGKYEWFPEGQMVPEFNDFSFDKPIGSLGVVKTTYGYHIIEVLERREGKTFKVATIDSKIIPQEDTKNEFYDKALEIYNKATEVGFDKAMEEMGYVSKTENLNLNMPRLSNPSLSNNAALIRWAFNAKLNEVSEPMIIGDRVVVACVKEIKEEGVMSFEAAKEKVTKEVLKIKKFEYMQSQISSAKTLEDIAKTLGVEVRNQPELTYVNSTIQGVPGNEDETIGKIFGLEVGKISSAIEGKTGIFVVKVNSKGERKDPDKDALDAKWSVLLSNLKGRANSGPMNALVKQADVKDYRKRAELKDIQQ